MNFAILRTQKLKSGQAVRRSLKHAFREQDTPNADPDRTPQNTLIGAGNTREALEKFNGMLPDKVRSNAVLAIEYLVTASPDAMQSKSREQQDRYFSDALKWLQQKHGPENVVCAGIHRDETTPHMYAYVVPKDERGRLNCRAFLGGAKALAEMQTDFAANVGRQHGLERGLEGSKARHTSIGQYYARVNAANVLKTPEIDVPAPKLLEGKTDYGQRVADSVIKQLGPELLGNRAKALDRDALAKQSRLRETFLKGKDAQIAHKDAQIAELMRPFRGLPAEIIGQLREHMDEQADRARERLAELFKEIEKKREQEKTLRPEPIKPIQRDVERDLER